jgi:hypothetical protein
MVIVALTLPAMMAFAGLAIDGSRAYDERRQMQNAADAASLAGTRKFNDWLVNPQSVNVADVDTVVRAIAAENGADPTQVQCNWIAKGDPTLPGAELGPCNDTGQALLASGVRVRTGSTEETYFIRVTGAVDFTAGAKATSQVQRLTTLGQGVPFLVCSEFQAGDGLPDGNLLAQDAAGVWTIRPDAFGRTIDIHGPQISDCGLGSSFKGVADDSANVAAVIPGIWESQTGVRAGQVRQDLGGMGGCDATDDLDGCRLLLPICPTKVSGGLLCTQMGLFQIHRTASNRHTGTLLRETVVLNEGIGGDLPIGQNEARLIRLVD